MRSIAFCIPFALGGIKYLEYLIDNLIKTAKNASRIKILVSYHDNQSLDNIKESTAFSKISSLIKVPPIEKNLGPFNGSANHTRALRALAKNLDEEIIIFSDYDMAFCLPNWDNEIENLLFISNYDLCGVEYQNLQFLLNKQNFPSDPLIKYQHLPNLSFFCIKKEVFKEKFNGNLSSYDEYLINGLSPFRLIDTFELAEINNLPFGSLQWLDSGWEIPEVIFKSHLKYKTFNFVPNHIQTILRIDPSSPPNLKSEVFYLKENTPFLCHFKKGTSKQKSGAYENSYLCFVSDIENIISRNYNQ